MINLPTYTKGDRVAPQQHIQTIKMLFSDRITNSIIHSQVINPYSLKHFSKIRRHYYTDIEVTDRDTVSQLFTETEKCTVLNFASYKHAGGGFTDGMMAQEECLCQASTLYPVLDAFTNIYYKPHAKALNDGLYADDGIISHDITFFNQFYERSVNADVITLAAPNMFRRDRHDPKRQDALRRRCKAVLELAYLLGNDVLILGAYGCGVFSNDPYDVARFFKEWLDIEYFGMFKKVVFAIPYIGKTGKRNYEMFSKVLR